MAVAPDAQHLDVDPAGLVDGRVVAGAFGGLIAGVAVGHAGVGGVDVDVVKELLAHEAVVALFMIHGQVAVFVQVEGAHTGEIQNAALTQADQLLIGGNGGGAGGKTQHTGRIQDHMGGHAAISVAAA